MRGSIKVTLDSFDRHGIDLNGHLYDFMLRRFEEPLIKEVMIRTNNNQTKAAKILGLNRGTFRKKLKIYRLID